MEIMNSQSIALGNALKSEKISNVLAHYKNCSEATRGGFVFEETVALCNNLRNISEGKVSCQIITDRNSDWCGKKNDPTTDLLIRNVKKGEPTEAIRVQAKCCVSAENSLKAITKSMIDGSPKYLDLTFALPSNQISDVEAKLIRKIEKYETIGRKSEISIFDFENMESEYSVFRPGYNKIYNLWRCENALQGLKKSEYIYTPSVTQNRQVLQKGLNARYIKNEILKANFSCIKEMAIKNCYEDAILDSFYLLKRNSVNQIVEEVVIRILKNGGASLAVAALTNELGKGGISVTPYMNSCLTAFVRSACHTAEWTVRLCVNPSTSENAFKKLNADMIEEFQRLGIKLAVHYIRNKTKIAK